VAITLERHHAHLVIEPHMGGTIAHYAWRGRDVLRPPEDAGSPLGMACFPLVPFANRIAYGTFIWRGRTIRLQPYAGEPHALHGQGWQTAWQVMEWNNGHAVLVFEHEADEWPWPYRAELRLSLTVDGLHETLSLTNHGHDSMPASLGLHPYFLRSARTKLTTTVGAMWRTDATQIPTTLAPPMIDFAKGVVVDDAPPFDHCFTGWNGTASIEQPDDGLRISVEAGTRFLQIFSPTGMPYFCVEPVTAMPDAVHRAEPPDETGLLALAPGATYTVSMTIKLEEAAS